MQMPFVPPEVCGRRSRTSFLILSSVLACGPAGGDSPVGDGGSSTTAALTSSETGIPPESGALPETGTPPETTSEWTGGIGTTSAPPSTTTLEPGGSSGAPVGFDLGTIPDSPKVDMGCRKVDFLFVVDNSGSMGSNQAQLLASFPGFIMAMKDALEGVVDSYHVGVLTSDDYTGNEPGCNTLGDLVTQTSGSNSSNQVCTPFAEGNRFATEQDDLEEVFPCMAQVGTSGSPIEQPVSAILASFDPSKRGPGDCNDGFLRDDAILVIVIVSDDPPYDFDMDDAHPSTDTSEWYESTIAAKNGDPEALVVIGFLPWKDIACVAGGESPNTIGYIESFGEQGVLASVCEPDYGPIFASTIETIVTTCENFDPPG